MDSIYLDRKKMKQKLYITEGSFSTVFKVLYNNKEMCYKEFNSDTIPNSIQKKRIELLCSINIDKNIVLPKLINVEDNNLIGYLSNYLDYKSINKYIGSITEELEYLYKTKELILKLHKNNIIHGDLHSGNILFNESKRDVAIIDFDNCDIGSFRIDKHQANDFVEQFITYNDISKDIDISMFNLLCYALVKNIRLFTARMNMSRQEYGIFDTQEAKKIINKLVDFRCCDEFLIDYINEDKLLYYEEQRELIYRNKY